MNDAVENTHTAMPGPRQMVRFDFVKATLWSVRLLVVFVVVAGAIGTVLKAKYGVHQWADFVVTGITTGSIYALIALGYTMVYGVLRLINFAHGDIVMAGAFAGFFVASSADRSGLLATHPLIVVFATMLVAVAISVSIALLVERIAYRPFRHIRGATPLISAIGASFFIQQTFRGMFGSQVKSYPDLVWQDVTINIGGFTIRQIDLLVIAAAALSMVVLYTIVHRTKMGTAIRAVSVDKEAATLMGINVNKVVIFTFVLGGIQAGIAGVLYAFVFKQVFFFMGFTPGIKAFGAAVLGGIGNVPGAMVGGIVLGVFESIGPALFFDGLGIPAPYQLRDVIAFTALIMVLIFRPNGLFGEPLAKERA